eukprot:11182369-Lingulodinium_polyedra.AAC.1
MQDPAKDVVVTAGAPKGLLHGNRLARANLPNGLDSWAPGDEVLAARLPQAAEGAASTSSP